MKFIVAPDSFKGTLSSLQVCGIVAHCIKKHIKDADVVQIPVSDGGEGMVDAYLTACGGEKIFCEVTAPNLQSVKAFYGVLSDGQTAVIEMAAASGLPLIDGVRTPLDYTSYGTGQLIVDAVEKGCKRIILGLGGSATMDGGIGMAQAMGIQFLDAAGQPVRPTPNGLPKICSIDPVEMQQKFTGVEFLIACDVQNPLCGPNGAANVFGPQKGATAEQIPCVDHNLRDFALQLENCSGVALLDRKGMGAAGGLALPLVAFCNAKLTSGIDLVLDVAGFDRHLQHAAMVITGEGRLDGQSLEGKVPIGIARRAQKAGIPVVAVAGCVGAGYEKVFEEGISAVFSTGAPSSDFDEIKKYAHQNLEILVDSLFAVFVMRACG